MKTKYIVLMIVNLIAAVWAFQYFDVKNMSTIGGILFVVGWLVVLGFIIRISGADWPARYFVPDIMRDYCMFDASSRGGRFGAIVSGAGGL